MIIFWACAANRVGGGRDSIVWAFWLTLGVLLVGWLILSCWPRRR